MTIWELIFKEFCLKSSWYLSCPTVNIKETVFSKSSKGD